jgi:RNA polymerase sigma-70 factor (ECF subfamily)
VAISRQELEDFYTESESRLFNFALRWTWNPHTAEEIVHDALIRIWERRDTVDLTTLQSLAYKTIQNLSLNEIRRKKLRAVIPLLEWILPPPGTDLESEFTGKQELQKLERELALLPVELKEVLLLCEFSEMTYAEIGLLLKIPEGTVASRKNRALKILKEGFHGKSI